MSTDTAFFGGIKVAAVEWSLSRDVSVTRLRDGSAIPIERGAALWQGKVTLAPAYHRNMAEVEARLAKLTGAGEFLLAYDPRHNGPRMDPGGVILGSATPTIHTLNSDNRQMRVTGLPASYVLSAGDWIGWQYGSNPTRYALHRLVTGATASLAGLTPLFEVTPRIRPGVATGAAVTLIRPPIKALIRDAAYGQGVPLITHGPSFDIIQTLR